MKRYKCCCGRKHAALPPLVNLIEHFGPRIIVTTRFGSWRVPRIYLAIHGLNPIDAPVLAHEYRWEEVGRVRP